jgi:hypothetical protein
MGVTELANGQRPPGGQAVRIHRDPQSLWRERIEHWHMSVQFTLQQPHLLHMVEQLPAGFRGHRGQRAQQHRLAYPCFQQLDALRDSGLRQPQNLGGPVEAGLLDHGGQGIEQFIIEHRFL